MKTLNIEIVAQRDNGMGFLETRIYAKSAATKLQALKHLREATVFLYGTRQVSTLKLCRDILESVESGGVEERRFKRHDSWELIGLIRVEVIAPQ